MKDELRKGGKGDTDARGWHRVAERGEGKARVEQKLPVDPRMTWNILIRRRVEGMMVTV